MFVHLRSTATDPWCLDKRRIPDNEAATHTCFFEACLQQNNCFASGVSAALQPPSARGARRKILLLASPFAARRSASIEAPLWRPQLAKENENDHRKIPDQRGRPDCRRVASPALRTSQSDLSAKRQRRGLRRDLYRDRHRSRSGMEENQQGRREAVHFRETRLSGAVQSVQRRDVPRPRPRRHLRSGLGSPGTQGRYKRLIHQGPPRAAPFFFITNKGFHHDEYQLPPRRVLPEMRTRRGFSHRSDRSP